MEEKVTIVTDMREMRSMVVKKLFELGVEIKTEPLEIGDFLLSNEVAVERKTTNDFLQSIIDGRLFQQISNMVKCFPKPVIIVEGSEDIYSLRGMHPNAIRAAISSIAVDFRLPIIYSQSEEETALFLFTIAKREQIDNKKEVNIRGEKKPLTDKFLQEYLVAGLPGIGIGIARNLLRHFKTVEKVFTANEEELKDVEKIGKKKAEKIRYVLTKEYKEECE
jgi:Fanconi anemia group M protein